MALVASFEQPTRSFEFAMIPNARKHIKNFSLSGSCIADPIRREERQAHGFSKTHCRLIAPLFGNIAVPLQFHIDILPAENSREEFNVLSGKEFGIHDGGLARFPKPSTEISAPT